MLCDKLTVLVNSCDAYEDLWFPFFTLYHRYWKEGRELKIILNSESKSYRFDGLKIETHNSNALNWGERLWESLREVKTEYVLMLLDDFFFDGEVHHDVIEKCVRYMDANKNMVAINCQKPYFGNNLSSRYDILDIRKNGDEYTLTSQPGIWRKKALMRLINKNESPWQFEVFGSLRTKLHPKYEFYILKEEIPNVFGYDWSGLDGCGVHRGKWQKGAPELFAKNGIEVDFSVRGFVGSQMELGKLYRARRNFDDQCLLMLNYFEALKRKLRIKV